MPTLGLLFPCTRYCTASFSSAMSWFVMTLFTYFLVANSPLASMTTSVSLAWNRSCAFALPLACSCMVADAMLARLTSIVSLFWSRTWIRPCSVALMKVHSSAMFLAPLRTKTVSFSTNDFCSASNKASNLCGCPKTSSPYFLQSSQYIAYMLLDCGRAVCQNSARSASPASSLKFSFMGATAIVNSFLDVFCAKTKPSSSIFLICAHAVLTMLLYFER